MKNYSSNRAQKGKTGYRTPSGWRASRPERIKRTPPPNLKRRDTNNTTYIRGHHQ